MNGEVSQISRIVSAARKALKDGGEMDFKPLNYEGGITFNFCDRKKSGAPQFHAKDPADWFSHLKTEGVKSVFMVESLKINRRAVALSNHSSVTIFVRYSDDVVTRFVATWSVNEQDGKWRTEYNEFVAENAPAADPEFRNEASLMEATLKDIAALADKLGEEKFAATFRKAEGILTGETPKLKEGAVLPSIPEDMLKYYLAADVADVFGAEGSWNFEPADKAKEQGLEKDYVTLSDRLVCSVRLMTMYAVNFPV